MLWVANNKVYIGLNQGNIVMVVSGYINHFLNVPGIKTTPLRNKAFNAIHFSGASKDALEKSNAQRASQIAKRYFLKTTKTLEPDSNTYLQEVLDGPKALQKTLNLKNFPKLEPGQPLYFVAEGSSLQSAKMAETLFEQAGHPVYKLTPGELSNKIKYLSSHIDQGQLVLISQSGNTGSLKALVQENQLPNAWVITNSPDSYLHEKYPNSTILLGAGKEDSVAATKSVMATVGALAAFANQLDNNGRSFKDIPEYLKNISDSTEITDQLVDWAEKMRTSPVKANTVFLSSPENMPLMGEVWLKLRETAEIALEAKNLEDFHHGPVTILSKVPNLLVVIPPDPEQAGKAISKFKGLLARYKKANKGKDYPNNNIFIITQKGNNADLGLKLDKNQVLTLPNNKSLLGYQLGVLTAMQQFAVFVTDQNGLSINSDYLGKVVTHK